MKKTDELVYLTAKEIDEIEKLNIKTAVQYIKDMPEAKKQLVMKQLSKEIAIKQWQTIASEKY